MPDLPPPKLFSTWKHYKGGIYTVLAVGHHSETKEPLVVYTHDGDVWCRPLKMWHEKIGDVARFTEIPSKSFSPGPRTFRE